MTCSVVLYLVLREKSLQKMSLDFVWGFLAWILQDRTQSGTCAIQCHWGRVGRRYEEDMSIELRTGGRREEEEEEEEEEAAAAEEGRGVERRGRL